MYNVEEPISLKSAWELMERLVDCLAAIRNGPCVLFIVFCPDYFVVGYGMDFAELYRNLPYVGVLKPEHYK